MELPNLYEKTGDGYIYTGTSNIRLELPALKNHVVGTYRHYCYSYIVDLNVPLLEYIEMAYTQAAYSGCVLDSNSLVNIRFQKLKHVKFGVGQCGLCGRAILLNLPALKNAAFDELQSISGVSDSYIIFGCKNIETLDIRKFEQNYIFSTQSNTVYEKLKWILIKKGFNISLNLKAWTATDSIAENECEFIKNFKLSIVDNLYDRSDMTKPPYLTITVSRNVYMKLKGLSEIQEDNTEIIDPTSYSRTKTLYELHCLTEEDKTKYGYDETTLYSTWIESIGQKKYWSLAHA